MRKNADLENSEYGHFSRSGLQRCCYETELNTFFNVPRYFISSKLLRLILCNSKFLFLCQYGNKEDLRHRYTWYCLKLNATVYIWKTICSDSPSIEQCGTPREIGAKDAFKLLHDINYLQFFRQLLKHHLVFPFVS